MTPGTTEPYWGTTEPYWTVRGSGGGFVYSFEALRTGIGQSNGG